MWPRGVGTGLGAPAPRARSERHRHGTRSQAEVAPRAAACPLRASSDALSCHRTQRTSRGDVDVLLIFSMCTVIESVHRAVRRASICGSRFISYITCELYSLYIRRALHRAHTTWRRTRSTLETWTHPSMMARLVERNVRSSPGAQTHRVFG